MGNSIQHLINHFVLVVDKSTSMQGQDVVGVFDKELQQLKQRSIELHQESRVSIYLFSDTTECLVFDMDVMRFESLRGYYTPNGNTAMMDAIGKAVEDHKKIPELDGDHAFLVYVLTDGQENNSRQYRSNSLSAILGGLPENWTVACLVPDASGKFEAKKFGIPGDCISVWDTKSERGIESAGQSFGTVTANYMTMRSTGTRGTKSGLFTLDASNVTQNTLKELPSSEYSVFPVHNDSPIKEYIESFTQEPYRLGSSYYTPTKPVVIQDHKFILVQDKANGKVYDGNLRGVLGIPAYTTTVNPTDHPKWRIFVQSTSTNRKLFKDTFVLVRK